jgi:hypothetical protein
MLENKLSWNKRFEKVVIRNLGKAQKFSFVVWQFAKTKKRGAKFSGEAFFNWH